MKNARKNKMEISNEQIEKSIVWLNRNISTGETLYEGHPVTVINYVLEEFKNLIHRVRNGRLSYDDKLRIKERYKPRCVHNGGKALAVFYGVSLSTIKRIVKNHKT